MDIITTVSCYVLPWSLCLSRLINGCLSPNDGVWYVWISYVHRSSFLENGGSTLGTNWPTTFSSKLGLQKLDHLWFNNVGNKIILDHLWFITDYGTTLGHLCLGSIILTRALRFVPFYGSNLSHPVEPHWSQRCEVTHHPQRLMVVVVVHNL